MEAGLTIEKECKPFDEEGLKSCLEAILSEQYGRRQTIAAIHREPFDQATSFAIQILNVELHTGERLRIFFKDLGISQLPKDGLEQRREREQRVYRDLLREARLGTARLYGAAWDEVGQRYWLFLEYVDGEILRDRQFEDWVRAAGWLGRMQGYFAQLLPTLEACDYLVQHDAEFYSSKAIQAFQAVAHFSDDLAKRLGRIVCRYDQNVILMANQPRTLVHGSFRPQNILVASNGEEVRICPVDWELAAAGSALYDLAFLSDGFQPPELYTIWDAYRQQLARYGITPPANDEIQPIVDCFWLHKILKSLSESVSWNFTEEVVAKLVGMAEKVRRVDHGN